MRQLMKFYNFLPIILCRCHLFVPIIYMVGVLFVLGMALYASPIDCGLGLLAAASGIPLYIIGVWWKNKPAAFQLAIDNTTIFFQKLMFIVAPEAQRQRAMTTAKFLVVYKTKINLSLCIFAFINCNKHHKTCGWLIILNLQCSFLVTNLAGGFLREFFFRSTRKVSPPWFCLSQTLLFSHTKMQQFDHKRLPLDNALQ